MAKRWIAVAAGSLALAACATTTERPAPEGPIAVESDSITYSTGPCFGACPVYSVTVSPDGTGTFTGKRFTAVTGERRFTLSRAQYDAFAARLAPYRPESGVVRYTPGSGNCAQVATDMPGVDVTWTRAIGDSQALHFYFGCDMAKNAAMRDALGSAPEALPIERFVGQHP